MFSLCFGGFWLGRPQPLQLKEPMKGFPSLCTDHLSLTTTQSIKPTSRATIPPPCYHQSTLKEGIWVLPAHLLFSGQIWLRHDFGLSWLFPLVTLIFSGSVALTCKATGLFSRWCLHVSIICLPDAVHPRCLPWSPFSLLLTSSSSLVYSYLQEEPPYCQHLSGLIKIMPKSFSVAALQGVKWSWSSFRRAEKPFRHNMVPHFGSQPQRASIIVVGVS